MTRQIQGQKFTHRIVRKQYGKFADAPPSPCRFFLRIENGVLELAPDLEPRRWFECNGVIARVGELQGDDDLAKAVWLRFAPHDADDISVNEHAA